MNQSDRDALIEYWLQEELGLIPDQPIETAAADASFRRYLRVKIGGQPYVIMDAPPEHEDIRSFIHIAKLLEAGQVHIPRIHYYDIERGLMLLEDFGTRHFLATLQEDSTQAQGLYEDALIMLSRIQRCDSTSLAVYDRDIAMREMRLFDQWYLGRHLAITLSEQETKQLLHGYDLIATTFVAQPKVFVHRDYHSRNLMHVPDRNPGVLDFQDAVHGPVTYDLVSLLRDSYIELPDSHVEAWREQYRRMCSEILSVAITSEQFKRWFDYSAAQRHLKVLGIFARLAYRDQKRAYLQDIPLTLRNLQRAIAPWDELRPLLELIESLESRGLAA